MAIDPSSYGQLAATLIQQADLCPLGPGQANSAVRGQLEELSPETLFAGQAVRDAKMAACCESALWLLHNYLDDSHTISQNIATAEGSYWHGIMHRREPDYSNAKYWFRQVGNHPIFGELATAARSILASSDAELSLDGDWSSSDFVDACESAARNGNPELIKACRQIALSEWRLLFDCCYQRAIG